ADLDADGRLALQRQQLLIAPHRVRAQLNLFAADRLANGVVVVIDFERAVVVGAIVDGGERIRFATQPTGHATYERFRHGPSSRVIKDGETGGAYRPGRNPVCRQVGLERSKRRRDTWIT